MATTAQQAGRKSFVDFDEFIEFQLKKTRSNIKLTDIFTAIAGVTAMVIGYLLVFVVLDHWVVDGGFGNATRWLMLGGLFAAATTWVVWRVVLPARKNVTGLYAARTIEETEPELKSGLVNLVDLQRAGRKVPGHIRAAMEKQTAVALAKTNVDDAVDRRPLMRLSYVLLALVVLFCLYTLISPKTISGSIWRALMPASDTAVDTTIKIDKVSVVLKNPKARERANGGLSIGEKLLPADVTIPARSKIDVVVDLLFNDEPPEEVVLYLTTQDGKYRDVPVAMKADPDEPKRYRARITGEHGRGILQNTSYRIEAGDAKAGPFQITLNHPPIATVNSVSYRYPAYMNRARKVQKGGDIETWEGATVSVKAVSDRPAREAWIVFHDTEDITRSAGRKMMTITAGTMLTADLRDELHFRADGSYPRFYHILCKDKTGLTDPRPALYGVTLIRDEPPKVEIVDPKGNEIDLPANTEKLPILYKASDPDFKLRDVVLRAEITRAGKDGQKPELLDEPVAGAIAGKSIRETFEWDLLRAGAKQGDSLRFRLEARDNKTPQANLGFSRWVTIRFVAPVDQKELQNQLNENRQRQQEEQEKDDRNQNGGDPQRNQPQDGGEGAGDKPKDGDQGKPNDKGAGKKSDRKKRGGTGQSEKTDDPQNGQNRKKGANDNPGTQRQKTNDDGSLSDEQIRELNQKRLEEQQREQNQENRSKKPKDGNNNPDGKPKTNEPGRKEQPGGMGREPDPNRPESGMPKNNTGKKQPDRKPNGMGNEPKKKTGEEKQPGMKPADSKQKQQTGPDGKPDGAGGQTDMGEPGTGKTNGPDGKAKGKPTNPDGSNPETSQPGKGSQPNKEPSKSKAQKSTDPVNGTSKPAPGKKADRTKPGTGTETGKADPNSNPKSKPTQSKNPDKIKTDPRQKKVTRPSKDTGQPKTKQRGGSNPKTAKQKPSRKTQEANPDQRPTKPKETTGQAKKKIEGKNPPGNSDLKNKQKNPKAQQSKPTEGGKTGSSRPSDQGKPGSKKTGAGDTSKVPGKASDATGKKTGQSGKKPGTGSAKRPTGKTQPGQSSQPPPDGDNKAGAGRVTPNQPGGNPTGTKKKDPKPNGQPGAGTGPFKNVPGKKSPPQPNATPKSKSEYGKKAVDLTLNYLEDKLNRGETDEKWLKEHGFSTKEQLKNAIDRSRDRLKNANLTEAQKRQRDLFHRSIYDERFQEKSGVLRGKNVRKRYIDGTGSSDNSEPPPQLKDYYKSFTESIGGGSKKK